MKKRLIAFGKAAIVIIIYIAIVLVASFLTHLSPYFYWAILSASLVLVAVSAYRMNLKGDSPVHYFVSYSHADGFGNKVVELNDIGFFPYADVAVYIGNAYNEKDVIILYYTRVPKKQYKLSK